jgi:hypothetical protein
MRILKIALFTAILVPALMATPASALHLCAKADIKGPDPTAPRNNSPIKLRTACKPIKEVSLGTTQQLIAIQSLDLEAL